MKVLLLLALSAMGNIVKSITARELKPFTYNSLPLGSIKASGWLHNEIRLSGDGLGGHLYDFYRFVRRSTWLGGDTEYSKLAESATYWFNYIVPLAWILDDDRLKGQARAFLDYTLEHQAEDGWLGPEKTRQTRGIWARSLLFFGLMQYAEADGEQTERIIDAMHKFVLLVHSMLKDNYTGLLEDRKKGDHFDPGGFGVSRSHELPVSLMWLYENHPRDIGDKIWETMEMMFEGGQIGGQDWTKFFVEGVFPTKGTPDIETSGFTHGVNLAQGLRYSTVLYRLTGQPSLIKQAYDAVNLTVRYQTSLSGTIVGDEHLGGLSPQRGSELCMAVESMFSYAYLYRFHGENSFADRVELAAFNALPAGVSEDWWAHQYVTQTNQPWAKPLNGNPFNNVVDYGNVFGLEPNFPCCTVNHPQGYPKFVASAFVRKGDHGLVHMLLSPVSVKTTIDNQNVQVECHTDYPFSDMLNYSVQSDTDFDFFIRVPEWTVKDRASIQVGNASAKSLEPDDSSLQHVRILKGLTVLSVHFPMEVKTVQRDDSVAIYHGPLLYAADIECKSTSFTPLNYVDRKPLPDSEVDPRSHDWKIVPTGEWRYAIVPSTVAVERVGGEDVELPSPVFSRSNPPVSLFVDAYPVDWPEDRGTAAVPPTHPAVDGGKKTRLKLIPFGAAKLHVAQFPVARLG